MRVRGGGHKVLFLGARQGAPAAVLEKGLGDRE